MMRMMRKVVALRCRVVVISSCIKMGKSSGLRVDAVFRSFSCQRALYAVACLYLKRPIISLSSTYQAPLNRLAMGLIWQLVEAVKICMVDPMRAAERLSSGCQIVV